METKWYNWLNPLHFELTGYRPDEIFAALAYICIVCLALAGAVMFILMASNGIALRACAVGFVAMYLANIQVFFMMRGDQ